MFLIKKAMFKIGQENFMVIWWGMIYKCEYFITLCLYHKAAYKVLSTVKKTEGMRATRRRRSTLKSQLPLWWPLPRSLMDTGANHLSLVKNICVCTSCVLSGAVSAAKGFGGVSHDFRCILCHLLGARPTMGLRIGWGSPHCLSLISALPLRSHVNLLSESNFSNFSIWKCRRWWYLPKWQQYQLKSVRLGTQKTAVIKW